MYDVMLMKIVFSISVIISVVSTCLLVGISGVVLIAATLLPGYLLYRFLNRKKSRRRKKK